MFLCYLGLYVLVLPCSVCSCVTLFCMFLCYLGLYVLVLPWSVCSCVTLFCMFLCYLGLYVLVLPCSVCSCVTLVCMFLCYLGLYVLVLPCSYHMLTWLLQVERKVKNLMDTQGVCHDPLWTSVDGVVKHACTSRYGRPSV